MNFKNILCPVDFYPASERSFEYAVGLASGYGARLHALHVVSRIVPTTSSKPVRTSPKTIGEERLAQRELERLSGKAKKAKVSAETEIRIGDPDVQILHTARDVGADLLVMGTHGRRGLEHWIMGSVVERVLRHSHVPLIAVGAAAPPALRRILVTTDFSTGTGDALDYACSIAGQFNASVTVLHVIDSSPAAIGWKRSLSLDAGIRTKLEELLPSAAGKVTARVETGTPYKTILKVIKTLKPGLVVMNTHGVGMMDRALIGTTTERVLRGTEGSCPMLLIPPLQKSRKKGGR